MRFEGGKTRHGHDHDRVAREPGDPASTPEEFGRDLRVAAAIYWYSRGLISQGNGAEIAGMNRREFLEALFEANVEAFQVDLDELTKEAELDLQARRERLAPDLSRQGGHP